RPSRRLAGANGPPCRQPIFCGFRDRVSQLPRTHALERVRRAFLTRFKRLMGRKRSARAERQMGKRRAGARSRPAGPRGTDADDKIDAWLDGLSEDDLARISDMAQERFLADFAELADALRRSVRKPFPRGADPAWCQQRQYAYLLALTAKFLRRWVGKD